MPDLIALRAVFGQDEANHGTVRYPVGSDGLVHVPPEAAPFLISRGGFAVVKTPARAIVKDQGPGADSSGMVRLHHAAANGCSYGGRRYQSEENGDVLVPAEAATELLAHGFGPVPQNAYAAEPEEVRKTPKHLSVRAAGGLPAGAASMGGLSSA